MATELGQAYIQIMPSAKGISGSIQKQFDPEAESAGKSAGSKLGAGLKIAAVAAVAATGVCFRCNYWKVFDRRCSTPTIFRWYRNPI